MNSSYGNNKDGKNSVPNSDEIDLISFDRHKRAEEIRMNEEYQREKRRREMAARRRAERIRQAKINRLKAMALLAVIGIGALFIVIGVITAIVKFAFSSHDNDQPVVPDNTVSAEETALLQGFSAGTGTLYSLQDNAFFASAGNLIDGVALSQNSALNIPLNTVKIYEFGELSERLGMFSTNEAFENFKKSVKNAPIFSNGYVWTEMENIKSSYTESYFYDTNTSFISAVANICLWEADSAFLSEIDEDLQPKLDNSQGMTVLQKLDLAVNYLFDGKTTDGGLKYDSISGLVYIHTDTNNGTSNGLPSNKWYNFRFGYLDAVTNVSFNRAMQDLSALYEFLGQQDQADKYAQIAERNAQAFNEKFWDAEKQRYIGCFDKNGTSYDYGFVFLNLEAIEVGIADKEKQDAIFTWLNGERLIESDTSKGSDIYAYGFAPRNTTVPAQDKWWDYLGGNLPLSAAGGYNQYYQNGGASLYTEYYDIMARAESGRTAEAYNRMLTLATAYAVGSLASSDSAACSISSNALSGLTPTAILRTLFGLDTDGIRLYISPDTQMLDLASAGNSAGNSTEASASTARSTYGVRGIGFAKNTYGFLFDGDTVYITAVSKKPVRISIGSLQPNTEYELVTVEGRLETETAKFTSDNAGVVEITADFGSTSYVKLRVAQVQAVE